MQFIINPPSYRSEYLDNLNKCFDGWGDEQRYQWVFERTVGHKSSDLMVVDDDEHGVIAGSGISYRQLDRPNGDVIDIGIMTGSWTLPEARGKGCFSQIIEASQDICKKHGIPYLTAFVTESNPSYRRLKAAGSHLVATHHLFAPKRPFDIKKNGDVALLDKTKEIAQAVYDRARKTLFRHVSFRYSFEEFYKQYIERPDKVCVLKVQDDYAVVEESHNAVKLLLITYQEESILKHNLKLISNWAMEKIGKKALVFTTQKNIYAICRALGFQDIPGYFTILKNYEDKESSDFMFESVDIQMGDKM